MESNEVLVILGSPNSPEGELSDIAKSRLDYAVQQYSHGKQVLCTGGWGKHFNVSRQAHAVYAKEFLIAKGIPETAFLESALSGNTVEDAVKSKEVLSQIAQPLITIITSDYHLERVDLIFNQVFSGLPFRCVGVNSEFLDAEQQAMLKTHERKAIEKILKDGLYF